MVFHFVGFHTENCGPIVIKIITCVAFECTIKIIIEMLIVNLKKHFKLCVD